jgi:hypothetical protein
MKKFVAMAAAGALAMSAFAGVASASGHPGNASGNASGKAYGKVIIDRCGASFGQLRKAAPHKVTPSKGAKYFVKNTLASHCPLPNAK